MQITDDIEGFVEQFCLFASNLSLSKDTIVRIDPISAVYVFSYAHWPI